MSRVITRGTGLLTAGLLLVTSVSVPALAAPNDPDSLELTVLATTDVHGNALNWDYFAETSADNDADTLGLGLLSTVVDDIRIQRGPQSVLLVDNGDAIQGTALTELYGKAEPVSQTGLEHPMATAFNYMGYDAHVVGNHEYDYGLDLLAAFEDDLNAPLLGANVVDAETGEPIHQPYTLIDRTIDGHQITIGVLGLVTPALSTFNKAALDGLAITDMVTAAETWVPQVRGAGADVVVLLAHSGAGNIPDAEYDPADLNQDVVSNIARMVSGIDVIIQGHTHQDQPQQVFTAPDGGQVIVTQPYYWARSLSRVDLTLVQREGEWDVDWTAGNEPTAKAIYAHEVPAEDPGLVEALAAPHEAAKAYIHSAFEAVAPSTELLRSRTSGYEDTAIMDFINHVQQETVRDALKASKFADLPVISAAASLTRTGVFPKGMVTTGHIGNLYLYPNTLKAVEISGSQLRDYLEHAARYYAHVDSGAEFDGAAITNAGGTPDYLYDMLAGVNYVIDVSRPLGERITKLQYPDGKLIGDDDRFILAVNDFRQTGAGGYPHVADAPVVYSGDADIRALLAGWARERGVINPADFFVRNWELVSATSVDPSPSPTGAPTGEPTATATPTAGPTGEPTSSASATPTGGATGGPTGGSTGKPTGAPTAGSKPGRLPNTGADVAQLIAGSLVLVTLGGGGILLARKRRDSQTL
ncbi:MAG: 5'-nucleotidase C-terminal domain-containing protein [Ancrocorticia sp.]